MTLQKWIRDKAVYGFPAFLIEDMRKVNIYVLMHKLFRTNYIALILIRL